MYSAVFQSKKRETAARADRPSIAPPDHLRVVIAVGTSNRCTKLGSCPDKPVFRRIYRGSPHTGANGLTLRSRTESSATLDREQICLGRPPAPEEIGAHGVAEEARKAGLRPVLKPIPASDDIFVVEALRHDNDVLQQERASALLPSSRFSPLSFQLLARSTTPCYCCGCRCAGVCCCCCCCCPCRC
jgi:hypothetical protein